MGAWAAGQDRIKKYGRVCLCGKCVECRGVGVKGCSGSDARRGVQQACSVVGEGQACPVAK